MNSPLMKWWQRAQKFPGGRFLFNRVLRFAIPYTGTVYPTVLELESGYAKVTIKDRRRVRNHLRSIHAVAQMNLAEFTTGLAMTSRLSPSGRAIITSLSIDFVKKARGTITAECHCQPFDESQSQEYHLESIVKNEQGVLVSKARAVWLIGPKKS